jgi:pyruvate-formate lyase
MNQGSPHELSAARLKAERYRREAASIRDATNIIRDERFREQLLSIADQYDGAAAEIEKHIQSAVIRQERTKRSKESRNQRRQRRRAPA